MNNYLGKPMHFISQPLRLCLEVEVQALDVDCKLSVINEHSLGRRIDGSYLAPEGCEPHLRTVKFVDFQICDLLLLNNWMGRKKAIQIWFWARGLGSAEMRQQLKMLVKKIAAIKNDFSLGITPKARIIPDAPKTTTEKRQ